jgi:ribonuclease E
VTDEQNAGTETEERITSTTPVTVGTDAVPAKKTTRTRRRAAVRPAGPPAAAEDVQPDPAAAPVVEPAVPSVVEPPVVEQSAVEAPAGDPVLAAAEAAPVKTPRKRASRKKVAAAPVVAEPSVETPVETPVEPAALAELPAPVGTAAPIAPVETVEPVEPAKRTRRRTRAKALTPEVTAAPETPEVDRPVPAEPAVEAPAAAEEEIPEDETPEQKETRVAAALPTGFLLFQAPEPVVAPQRRRRAASRPAGPPQAPDAEPEAVSPSAEEPLAEDELLVPLEDAMAEDEADEDDDETSADARRRRRRRGGRGRRGRGRNADDDDDEPGEAAAETEDVIAETEDEPVEDGEEGEAGTGTRRRRRRRRRGGGADSETSPDDPPNTVVKVREPRSRGGGGSGGGGTSSSDVTGVRGSTRLEAKKQRRREGREAGRRRTTITESEFLARRESVDRVMVVRQRESRTQIAVLEDDILVEHYVARESQTSMVGNVYLGKVQNVLPSMEAAFIDIGKGRNAVLYAGEVNWDAAGLDGQPRRIEHALKSGEAVLVQVTKDPLGHKGARLTSQISLPGRYLVYVPEGSMTGISRKLPDVERTRLKKILRQVVPDDAGVIVRTAAEGASEEELQADVARLQAQWEDISKKAGAVHAPALLYGEPDLAIRVVRDIFNEDFAKLVISGEDGWEALQDYLGHIAPDLVERLERWDGDGDVFAAHRIDEQLAKALERKVWLPSGGSLVIDRTEAMTVVDVNTGRFTGAGGNLEETVTRNNLEAAEEIVRQLRLRDLGGIIVIDFIDMVLESNRDLVLRRLLECLGRDRTKHQVAEVTSLGLVQMTRKRVGQGLLEVFSQTCEVCGGRGLIIHDEPVEKRSGGDEGGGGNNGGGGGGSNGRQQRRKGGGGNASKTAAAEIASVAAASAVPVS